MRIRHRIPTVFSLYMVDVMCCALGCVILMWLTNLQASEEQNKQASAKLIEAQQREDETIVRLKEAEERAALTAKLLADTEKRAGRTSDLLKETSRDRDAAYLMLADLNARLEKSEAGRKDLERKLTVALALSRELDEKVKDKSNRVALLEKDLAVQMSQLKDAQATATLVPELQRDLKTTRDKLSEETALAGALEKETNKRLKELAEVNKSLADLRDSKATLEKTVDARDKDLAAARQYKSKWEAAEERAQLLEKQMTERQKELALAELSVTLLNKEKKSWSDEAMRVKNAAEARFAGIQLTGKRVVFLVDMSGSMELVDETTLAPAKWLGVRETLAKIMRSLPDLEKFQVIVFSDKSSYLFGGNGDWIDYDPRTTSDRVFKALSEIKPKNGTNMYTAMEAAFKLRADGLDTIYLFSDGLPNMGEGLKPEQAAKMTEMQVGEVLGKYIRRKLKNEWNRSLSKQATVRINTVGFFYESPDVGAFLWALARENDGSFVGMSKP
jgi:von Willebrand factor type A domain